jgi:hypothetical protein
MLGYATGYAWIVVFVALLLADYRTARVLAILVVGADAANVLHQQLAGALVSPFASWAYVAVIDVAPVLAMAAFHRDAPPIRRWPWALALPAWYLLVSVPVLWAELSGHAAWVPDVSGRCCLLLAVVCLFHAVRVWSGRTGTGVWSLTLLLLAAVTGLYRLISLPAIGQDPHLIKVGLVELLILAVAAGLVAPDAVRSQAAVPARLGYQELR